MPLLKNARHELYCQGIVEGKTSDQAFIDAGFKANRGNASRLKANENITARIKELQEKGLKRHNVTVDRIIEEYAKLGFSDIRQMFNEEGKLLLPHELPDEIAGALSGLEIVTVQQGKGAVEHIAKFKLADKRGALQDLAKHFNMFTDDITIVNNVENNNVSDLELARRIGFILAKGAHAAG